MSELSHVFKLALGAVWTAGFRPTREEKWEIQRACGWFSHQKMNDHIAQFEGNGFDGMRDYFQVEAIRALTETGYPIAEKPTGLDLLQPKPGTAPTHKTPQPGDIVRAARPWSGCSEFGLQGVLGSQRRGFTIANRRGGWYVGTDPERTNCADMGNGGPASIGYLDTLKLRESGETDRLYCWAFAFSPEAHTGVHFYLPVRVWDWDGSESDFIGWEEAEEMPHAAAL